MPGLTDKLFDKLLDPNQNIAVTVNDELLQWLCDDSEEYHNLVESQKQNDSIGIKKNLKELVFKLYKEKKLKDIVFFKYLAWSGQGHLCKLIGYGNKRLNEWMEEKQKQSQERPSINQNSSVNSSTDEPMETDTNQIHKPNIISNPTNIPMEAVKDRGKHGDEVFADSPRLPLHYGATVKPSLQSPVINSPERSSKPSAAVGTTHIIYSEEDSDDVLGLSDLLHAYGIKCDTDQYHSHENILDWGMWCEKKIKECAKGDGFVLLICSAKMHAQLSKNESSRIQMKFGHIDSLSLNSLIKEEPTTGCIIPVCLKDLQMENIPKCLTARSHYHLLLDKLDSDVDPEMILSLPQFKSLRSLVYRLKKLPEVERSSVAS